MENDFFDKARNIRVPSHALWAMQRTSGIPTLDQQDPYGTYRHVLHSLSGRRFHLLENLTTTPKRRQQHT